MKTVLFAALNFLTFLSVGQKIVVQKQEFPIDLSSEVLIFEDKTSKLPFEEIQQKTFVKNTNKVVIIPFSDHTFWLKFSIQNKLKNEKDWVFRWVNSLTEEIDFYIPQADGKYKIIKEGGLIYKPQNKFIENLPVANFQIQDDTEHTFFIKIKSQKGHSGILEIFTKESLIEEKYSKFKREGLFNGLFILRLFYVILLAFFIIKDQVFQRYSLLILLRSLGYWGIMGILGSTISKNATIAMHLNLLFYFLVPAAYLLVIKSVLEFKRFPKIIQIFHQILIYLTLFFAIIALFDYRWYWLKASTFMIAFNILYSLVLYIFAFWKKYKIDWAYSIPILLGAVANLYLPMRLLGMSDFPGTFLFSTICFVAEILLFGFFVGKIIKNYENNKVKAENELIFNKAQTDKLKELDTLKTTFFTNISHEFRTPLTLILAPIKDLRKKNPANEIYQIIHRNAERLLELINQLLDISKLEAGQMNAEVRKYELVSYFRTLTSAFSSLAESRNIIFEVSQNKNEVYGYIDKDKIEKIITNLLSNAIKFSQENAHVAVKINYSENHIFLEIKDEGIGIAKEKIDKIFDRFYQIEESSKRKFEGTGIGLALVKELVSVLKGEISVESQQNIGTSFFIKLPIDKETWEENIVENEISTENEEFFIVSSTNSMKNEEKQANSNEKILLVVDDNDDIRAYINSVFRNEYRIIEAINGKDGVLKASQTIPDLIISDLMMPEMDGFEFCKTLKSNEKTSHIPIIMLTAKANIESRIEGLELGADDYLLKPFNTTEIQVRVRNLINKQQNLHEFFNAKTIELKPKEVKVGSIDKAFLIKVKDILENHLSDNKFSAENFSEKMNMSQSQLNRKLKALSNQSSNEIIRDFRLQRAADLLSQKAGTVSEIASQVGFEHLSYFAKVFHEKFGKLPSEYSDSRF